MPLVEIQEAFTFMAHTDSDLTNTQTEKAKEYIHRANKMLGRARVKLEVKGRGNWISLRGTLPPRPTEKRIQPYQQRISLKCQANDWETVRRALTIAKEIDLDLNRGEFSWYKLDGVEDPDKLPNTVGDWVDKFKREWWAVNSNKDTWRSKYKYLTQSLIEKHGEEELSVPVLREWIIESSEKNTDYRKRHCRLAKTLAEMAGLPTIEIDKLRGNYSSQSVNPRNLPSDDEILQIGLAIADPGWRFIYGMLATYGLRPHEVFKFDRLDNGIIRIDAATKTGDRIVPPLHAEWIEKFNLTETVYPRRVSIKPTHTNSELGTIITNFFNRVVKWNAYNLRHAYSRRWFEKGVGADIAAKFMGHSPMIHSQTYRAWIDEQLYLDIARKLTQS